MELLVSATLPQFEDYRWLEDHRTPTNPTRKAKWLRHREIAWDNTTRKHTPSMLKGYRPITFEPCVTLPAPSPPTSVSDGSSRPILFPDQTLLPSRVPILRLACGVCRWADDSIRFGEERALGFDPWGTGKSWEQEVPEVQATLFDQVMRYHDWRIKRERLKNVLQTTDEYRLLRA